MCHSRFLSIIAILACLCAAGRSAAVEDTWQYTTTDPGEGWQRPDAPQCESWKMDAIQRRSIAEMVHAGEGA